MSDEGSQTTPDDTAGSGQSEPADSWEAIGRQIGALGAAIGSAVRAAADDPDVKRHASEAKAQLESLANKLGEAVDRAAESEQGKRFREEAGRAADSVASAGRQAAEDVRPHVASALEAANETLRSMVERLEQHNAERSGSGTDSSEPPGSAAESPLDEPEAATAPETVDEKPAADEAAGGPVTSPPEPGS
jgi:hypothetical protein